MDSRGRVTDISLVFTVPSAVLARITSSSAVFSNRAFCKDCTVFVGYCDYNFVTHKPDIVTIFPIPKANFSTVALLPCDYQLVYLSDIVTTLGTRAK